jgi:hypothetical protein
VDPDKSRRVIGGDWCNELAPGGPYFTVSYQQGGVNLPEVDTLVYLGSTQLEDEVGEPKTHFLFQLARSYQEDGDWTDPREERAKLWGRLAFVRGFAFTDFSPIIVVRGLNCRTPPSCRPKGGRCAESSPSPLRIA